MSTARRDGESQRRRRRAGDTAGVSPESQPSRPPEQPHVASGSSRSKAGSHPKLTTRLYDVWSQVWSEVLRRHSLTGIVVATLFYVAANTPSLLPRPWWLQGIVAAVSAVLGYAAGNVIGLAARAVIGWMGLPRSTYMPSCFKRQSFLKRWFSINEESS